jgi:hypothetical protein
MICDVRKELSPFNGLTDIMGIMMEGNPGALRVMCEVAQKQNNQTITLNFLLNLDDMNMRGAQIYVAWNDFCKNDHNRFIECVTNRDEKMIEAVNTEGKIKSYKHKAVKNSGSYKREIL